jgi:hypothetical protein
MNRWLIAGGMLSAAAGLLHVAVIVGGPAWYRFFGAGEAMARSAAAGSWYPPAVTAVIVLILASWAAYAFSGAGLIPRLPLLRTALVLISLIYLLRAVLWIPIVLSQGRGLDAFTIWSSLIVLVYGLAYAIGTWTGWRAMSQG